MFSPGIVRQLRFTGRRLCGASLTSTITSQARCYSAPSGPEGLHERSAQREHDTVDFGFQTIDRSTKNSKVRGVFDSVASSYDAMNDVMSFGIHRLWKDHFVRKLNPGRKAGGSIPMKILDLAGGTGDIAFRLLDHSRTVNGDWDTKVTVCDINEEMLKEGQRRALSLGYSQDDPCLSFLVQNGEDLDAIQDESVDLLTIAFGIRNFTNKEKALRTAHRVLKPGGVFSCLEFSRVNYPILSSLYRRYSFTFIPMMGQLVAGDRDSYQYLVESIAKFPRQEEFASMIKDAGFRPAGSGWEDLSFGVAAIHTGVKV